MRLWARAALLLVTNSKYLSFVVLALAACAAPSNDDVAGNMGVAVELEELGPGVRVRPAAGTGTLVSAAPAGLPSGATVPTLVGTLTGGAQFVLSANATRVSGQGNYQFAAGVGVDDYTLSTGQTIDVTPVYLYAALPMLFDHPTLDTTAVNGVRSVTAPTIWTIARSQFGAGRRWSFQNDVGSAGVDIPFAMPASSHASRKVDLTSQLAAVHLELDDVDPDYPTYGAAALYSNATWVNVREVATDFLVAPGRKIDIFTRSIAGTTSTSSQVYPSAAFLPSVQAPAAGGRVTITLRRLEVEDVQGTDGAPVRGRFSVVHKATGREAYEDVPTHTGVDLPPGAYTLTVSSKDRLGIEQVSTQDITL